MIDALFGNMPVLQKSLGGLTARQRAIGENVANSDTPGYKRLEVAYEQQLRAALSKRKGLGDELPLQTASGRHFSLGPAGDLAGEVSRVSPSIHRVTDESFRNDGNNVNVELEMANMAETNIRYNAVANMARHKFEGLKTTIREIR